MNRKEVGKVFVEFQLESGNAMYLSERYGLSEKLNLTNLIDQRVLVASMMLSLAKYKLASLEKIISKRVGGIPVYALDRDRTQRFLTRFEEKFTEYKHSKYEESSNRPELIQRAVDDLVAQSVQKRVADGIDPTLNELIQWGNRWEPIINSEETTGLRPEIIDQFYQLYRRKPRLQ